MTRAATGLVLAALLGTVGCRETTAPLPLADTAENVRVEQGIVYTPSGAVFSLQEWRALPDRSLWLIPASGPTDDGAFTRVKNAVASLVSGQINILCHTNGSACNQIPTLVPGAIITKWSDAQWTSATVADFAKFNMIYMHDGANRTAGIVDSKAVWVQAVTGRVALTSVHYEHCNAASPGTGPCIVLKSSTNWIIGGASTGLLSSTASSAPLNGGWMPTTGVFAGVSYGANGGGYDIVKITDPGHATMAGSTDASLSNFGNSAHSYFNGIGSFTEVARVCSVGGSYPNACTGVMKPNFLVTSVAVQDQDGDGVPDAQDNCPTISNASQADANGNGVGDACESAPSVTVSPSVNNNTAPGTTITFTATAQDSDNPLSSLTYEWRVNGIVQAGQIGTSFTATFNADATVRVTVRDPGNLSGFADASVKIVTNRAPTASFAAPFSGEEGRIILVNVTAADADNDPLTYKWDINQDAVIDSTTTTPHLDLVFPDQGIFTVQVTVEDGKGGSVSATATVNVANVTPLITAISAPGTIAIGGSYALTASFKDPGQADNPWVAAIDWGDNSSGTASVASEAAGLSTSHAYTQFGVFTVTLTMTDKDGATSAPMTTTVTTTDPSPPVVTPHVIGPLGQNDWYTGDVSITWDVADAESGITASQGCGASSLQSNTTAAGTTYTCTATNGGGLTATGSVTVKRDDSAPVINPIVTGTPGMNGWFTSDVHVSWTVSDDVSGIASLVSCDATTLSSNTTGQTYACTATNGAGLSSSGNVTVKRDAAVPQIVPAVVGTLGLAGWYVSDVNLSWSVTADVSGVQSSVGCSASTLSANSTAAGVTYTCSATSGAGLSASASQNVKRDATLPVVSYTGNAGVYTVDQQISVSCSATDAAPGSGLASQTCANVTGAAYTFALGTHTYSADAYDVAGNKGSGSTSFTVQVTYGGLCALVKQIVTQAGVANSLCVKLAAAQRASDRGNMSAKAGELGAYANEVKAQTGKFVPADKAAILLALAAAL